MNLIEKSLEIGSIKVNILHPFTWTSGYKMPIYNDNRMLLFYPSARKMVVSGFVKFIRENDIDFDIIAGTATAGIPHATSLADYLEKPLIYIRTNKKAHGTSKTIEGANTLAGKKILLIEDLISTGKSSEYALQCIRAAGGQVEHCLSIFSYNFINTLPNCTIHSIIDYHQLYDFLKEEYPNEIKKLEEWHTDPFNWGIYNEKE